MTFDTDFHLPFFCRIPDFLLFPSPLPSKLLSSPTNKTTPMSSLTMESVHFIRCQGEVFLFLPPPCCPPSPPSPSKLGSSSSLTAPPPAAATAPMTPFPSPLAKTPPPPAFPFPTNSKLNPPATPPPSDEIDSHPPPLPPPAASFPSTSMLLSSSCPPFRRHTPSPSLSSPLETINLRGLSFSLPPSLSSVSPSRLSAVSPSSPRHRLLSVVSSVPDLDNFFLLCLVFSPTSGVALPSSYSVLFSTTPPPHHNSPSRPLVLPSSTCASAYSSPGPPRSRRARGPSAPVCLSACRLLSLRPPSPRHFSPATKSSSCLSFRRRVTGQGASPSCS
ncbi:hypothetical protein Mapa_003097 [Marchantia paleacea]|nr:hypothetical protein Mapa_003097 [Marchantia paleacea]